MGYLVKEAQFYFEKNPTYLKEVEIGEIQNIDLKKHVEKAGVTRNPYFGFPIMTYEDQFNDRKAQHEKSQ